MIISVLDCAFITNYRFTTFVCAPPQIAPFQRFFKSDPINSSVSNDNLSLFTISKGNIHTEMRLHCGF